MMPHQAIAMGWQYLQTGNVAAAEAAVRPLLATGINDDLVPLIGAIRLQQGRFSEAAPLFERARKLFPGDRPLCLFPWRGAGRHEPVRTGRGGLSGRHQTGTEFRGHLFCLGPGAAKAGTVPRKPKTPTANCCASSPTMPTAYIALASVLAETGQFAEAEAPLQARRCSTPAIPMLWPASTTIWRSF